MNIFHGYLNSDLKYYIKIMAAEIERRRCVWTMTDAEARAELSTCTDDTRRAELYHSLHINNFDRLSDGRHL